MKITREGQAIAQFAGLGGDPDLPPGAEPSPDCCDDGETPPDRGNEGNAFALQSSTLAFVQTKQAQNANTDPAITVILDNPPTVGNLLIATYSARSAIAPYAVVTPTGWTRYAGEFSGPIFDGGASIIFYKIVDSTDDTLMVDKNESVYAHLSVSEFAGNLSFDVGDDGDDVAATTALVTGSITPTGDNVLLYAAFNQSARTAVNTWTGSFTELADANVFTSGPTVTQAYRLVAAPAGTYAGSATSDESDGYGWAIISFTAGGEAWSLPAPNTVDGDDATYGGPYSGTDVLRVDLGGPFRIVRSRLRIACQNAGSRTYTIKGANLPDFSDSVDLVSKTFTAIGSYTPQDVEFLWATTTDYRYFELSGTSESRRIHTWELFEETPGEIIVENPADSGALDDLQDVLDDIYAAIASADTFVLRNRGGEEMLAVVAASGSTETIDLIDGNVHDITLTADCTFTFAVVASGVACVFTLVLRQDGTGGWTPTWPGSVEWGGAAPTLDDTASSVSVLTFFTLDGGTVWYGFATGGGGSSGTPASTVEDETTWGITPAVGTDTEYARQDHTHGSPANPVSEAGLRDVGHWEVVVSGTGPPVAVSTPADDDWVYAWVPG